VWIDNTPQYSYSKEEEKAIVECTTSNKGADSYVVVKTGGQEDNAVVSFSYNGVVKWSWHIWNTPDKDIIEAGYGASKRWMDRNLGALISDTEIVAGTHYADMTGLNYQWGRKDPLPSTIGYYLGGGDTNMSFNGVRPNDVMDATAITLQASVEKPRQFARTGWMGSWQPYGSNQNNSWRGTSNGVVGSGKTLFDPCPEGWRVPTLVEFPAIENKVHSILYKEVTESGSLIRIPVLMTFIGGDLPTLPFTYGLSVGTSTLGNLANYIYLISTADTSTNASPMTSTGSSYTAMRLGYDSKTTPGTHTASGKTTSASSITNFSSLRCIRE
jgi:hypothetical protein